MLRIYDMDVELFNGIKSIYVNFLACVRVKGSENECFRIGCIMSPSFSMCIWMQ